MFVNGTALQPEGDHSHGAALAGGGHSPQAGGAGRRRSNMGMGAGGGVGDAGKSSAQTHAAEMPALASARYRLPALNAVHWDEAAQMLVVSPASLILILTQTVTRIFCLKTTGLAYPSIK